MKALWTRVGAYVICRDSGDCILLTRFEVNGHPAYAGDPCWGQPARTGNVGLCPTCRQPSSSSGRVGRGSTQQIRR